MNSILLKIQKIPFLTLMPFVVLLGVAGAKVIENGIITWTLLKPPAEGLKAQPRRSNSQPYSKILPRNTYEETIEGSLIRGKLNIFDPKADSKDSEAQKKAASLATEEVPGSDEMVIWGTVSGSPIFARVAIQEKGEKESEEYSIGNMVGGYKVKAILPRAVILDKNGIALRVETGEKVGDARKRYLENLSNQEEDEDLVSAETVKQIVSRELIHKHLNNPTAIYKNARFGPNTVNGKIEGFKLYQVGKSNILYQFGARSGDLVLRINGTPLNDTGKMFEIFNAVKAAPKITVDLDRKGKIISYEFTVEN